MTGLGPQARALVEASQRGDEPTPADRERVRAQIAKRLATGAAAGIGTAVLARWFGAAYRSARNLSSLRVIAGPGQFAAKALLATALAGLVGASAAAFARRVPRPVGPVSVAASPAAPASVDAPVPNPPPLFVQDPPHRVRGSARTPEASAESPLSTAPSPGATPIPSTPRTARASGGVAAEVRLLDDAHAATRKGDPERALALLDEHARRYPKGALGEEREAARVAALCALGRTAEAREATSRFLRAAPASPLAGPLRASCGAAPAKP